MSFSQNLVVIEGIDSSVCQLKVNNNFAYHNKVVKHVFFSKCYILGTLGVIEH